MAVADLEVKRKHYVKVAKLVIAGVVCAVISPFIFLVVKGLIGLMIAAALGITFISLAPVVSFKFANWKLKAIKAEAAKNPIETLQNVFIEKQSSLARFKQAITDFATHVKTLEDKVDWLRKQYPSEVPKFQATLDKMRAALDARQRKYKQVNKALVDFAEEIKKAQVVWEVSQAAQEATRAAGMTPEDPYEKIKAETAVDAVQESLNQAIAELETDLMAEDADLSLESESKALPPRQAIYADDIMESVKEKEKVRR